MNLCKLLERRRQRRKGRFLIWLSVSKLKGGTPLIHHEDPCGSAASRTVHHKWLECSRYVRLMEVEQLRLRVGANPT